MFETVEQPSLLNLVKRTDRNSLFEQTSIHHLGEMIITQVF